MNIFATDKDPRICAKDLDDKRVIKMVLETAQLICTCLNLEGKTTPYRSVHVNHPITRWLLEHPNNLPWLVRLGVHLGKEYTYRFSKTHSSAVVIDKIRRRYPKRCEYRGLPLRFHNSARNLTKGVDFSFVPDTHEAYKLYLCERWKKDTRVPVWTNRSSPDFYT